MGTGYTVDPEELRGHSNNLEALKDRLTTVLDASNAITQDDEAYGTLCGWISGILEGRHQEQDSLIEFALSNLAVAAQALRSSADEYENSDGESHTAFTDLEAQL